MQPFNSGVDEFGNPRPGTYGDHMANPIQLPEYGSYMASNEKQGTPGRGVLQPSSTAATASASANPLDYYAGAGQEKPSAALLKMPAGPPAPVSAPAAMPPPQRPSSNTGTYGNYVSGMGDAGMMMAPVNPAVGMTGAAAKAVGTGMQLYAAFKEADQAEQEFDALMAEWKKTKRREEADYDRELKRQKQQDWQYGSAQAAALEDRFASSYGGYRQGGQI